MRKAKKSSLLKTTVEKTFKLSLSVFQTFISQPTSYFLL